MTRPRCQALKRLGCEALKGCSAPGILQDAEHLTLAHD
jgi:hypothetical protein